MKKLLFVLACVLFIGTLAQAQTPITIGGTGTSGQGRPIGGSFGYIRSASLYKSSEVTTYGYITRLAWRKMGTTAPYTVPIKIYLKEISDTILKTTDSLVWNDLIATADVVYDGDIVTPPATGFFNVDLMKQFQYLGTGNLLVLVESNVGGAPLYSPNSPSSFYTPTLPTSSRTFAYAESNNFINDDWAFATYSSGVNNFRPDIQITLNHIAPGTLCRSVTNLTISNIAQTSADINWVSRNAETEWEVSYKDTSSAVTTWARRIVYSTTATLSSLTSNTPYFLKVRAICGASDTSLAVSTIFKTNCNPATLPIAENFDGYTVGSSGLYNAAPSCWSWIKQNSGAAAGTINTGSASSSWTNEYTLRNGSSTTAQKTALISPYFTEPLNMVRVRFAAKASSNTTTLKIGYLTNPSNINSFQLQQTITLTTAWAPYTISFATASGAGNYIAFLHGQQATSQNISLDDIFIETIPVCPDINFQSINVSNITATTAIINFEEVPNAIGYDVRYRIKGASTWENTTASSGSQVITNLTSSKFYEISVRANCTNSNTGAWSYPITFWTAFALPIIETFDLLTIDGWNFKSTNTSMTAVTTTTAGEYVSPTKGLKLSNGASAANNKMFYISPKIDSITNVITNVQIRFKAKGSVAGLKLSVGTIKPDNINSFTIVDSIPLTINWNTYIVSFVDYEGSDYYIALGHNNNAVSTNIFIDDITINKIPLCQEVSNIKVTNLVDTSFKITWRNTQDANGYVVKYWLATNPESAQTQITMDNYYTVNGLAPLTNYVFQVKANCTPEIWTDTARVTTTKNSITPPLIEDFEGTSTWDLVNGSQTNKWYIDTAAKNGGLKGLYISDTNGIVNRMANPNANSWVYATKTIQIDTVSDYRIMYDWKCVGTSNAYAEVWLVPSTTPITAGSSAHNFQNYEGIKLYGPTALYGSSTWKTKDTIIHISEPNAYKLVFFWSNRMVGNPPAAIDNVKVIRMACDAPENLAVTNITDNSMKINWTGSAEMYNIKYKKTGDATWTTNFTTDTEFQLTSLLPNTEYQVMVQSGCRGTDTSVWTPVARFKTLCSVVYQMPWNESFEILTNATEFVPCMQAPKLGVSTYNNLANTTYNRVARTGTKSVNFRYAADDYIFTPMVHIEAGNSIRFSFWYITDGEAGWEKLEARVCTGQRIQDTIAGQDTTLTSVNNTIYKKCYFDFAPTQSGDYCFAIHCLADNTPHFLTIDDLKIDLTSAACVDEVTDLTVTAFPSETQTTLTWNSTGNSFNIEYRDMSNATNTWLSAQSNTTSITLTGLTGGTPYETRVQANCGTDVGDWSGTINFTTICQPLTTANLPFYDGFDSVTSPNLTACWTKILQNPTATIRTFSTTSHVTAPNSVTLNNSTSTPTEITMLVSPPVSASINVTNMRTRFRAMPFIYSDSIQVGVLTNPLDASTFIPVQSVYLPTGTWTNITIDFSGITNPNTIWYVGYKHGNAGQSHQIYVDNINIEPIPSCPDVNNVSLVMPAHNSLRIGYNSTAANFNVSYRLSGSTSAWTTIPISGTTATINGLSAKTSYDVKVQSVCGSDLGYWTDVVTCRTTQTPAQLPFIEDFEDSTNRSNWEFANGSQLNKWYTGTAVSNGGTYSIYISNDNGVSNEFTPSMENITHVYRDIEFSQGHQFRLSFDWRASGEATYDYLRVSLVDLNVNPSAGRQITTDTLFSKLNVNPNFTTKHIILPGTLSGETKRLVFSWRDSAALAGHSNPAAAVDNIKIESYCSPVIDVSVNAVGTTATATWTPLAGQTEWQVICMQGVNIVASTVVTNPTYIFTNLVRGNTYTVSVRNICAIGDTSIGEVSAPFTINHCNDVTNVTVSHECTTTAIVQWNADGAQNQWQLSYVPQSGGTTINKIITNVTTDTLIQLTPNTTYELRIRPVCAIGDTGNYSNAVTVQTISCPQIQDLTISRTDDSIFVSWLNNKCHLYWEIRVVPRGSDVETGESIITATYQGTYVKIDNVNESYDVYVRGYCGDGYGTWIKGESYGIKQTVADNIKIILAPNPAKDYTTLSIEGAKGNIEMTITNLNGKRVQSETINAQDKKELQLNKLPKGNYIVRLTSKSWTKVEKLIVQ